MQNLLPFRDAFHYAIRRLNLHPITGAIVRANDTEFIVTFSDKGSGVNLATFTAHLDDNPITSHFKFKDDNARYLVDLSKPLLPGKHTFKVTLADYNGNRAHKQTTFTIDRGSVGPTIEKLKALRESFSPVSNPYATVAKRDYPMLITLREPATIKLSVISKEKHVIAKRSYKVKSGQNKITWDGLRDDGKYPYPGYYRVEVRAYDKQGHSSVLTPRVLS